MHIKVALLTLSLLAAQVPQAPYEPSSRDFITLPKYRPIAQLSVPYKPLPTLELTAYTVAAPATYGNAYEWGNCTWYVAGRIPVPNSWGDANTWAENASNQGYVVSTVPIIGAIAQTSAGYYGHVAIVSAIDNNGLVRIEEMNVLGLGVASTRWVPISSFVYIYV